MRNLGPTLREWRQGWNSRRDSWTQPGFDLPSGEMKPLGYIAMRHGVLLTRPVKAYTRWLDQIPREFRDSALGQDMKNEQLPSIDNDQHCLSLLKNYNSLMPLAQEARKPIFLLRPADGAIGSHANTVQNAYTDFKTLARDIAERIGLALPEAHQ